MWFTGIKVGETESHMDAIRKYGGFSVTNVVSQQHKGTSLRVIKKISQEELGFLWIVFKSVEVFFVVIGLYV